MPLSESSKLYLITSSISHPLSERIGHLQNASQAIEFAGQNYDFVQSVFHSYDHLLGMFSTLTPKQLSIMPQTQAFLDKLGPVPLPQSIHHMLTYPLWTGGRDDVLDSFNKRHRGINDLVRMMQNGQENLTLPPENLHPDSEAILFGTRVNNPRAYIVGLAGHALERKLLTILPAAEGKSWQKDDFLHAANEVVLLWNLESAECPLYSYFVQPNSQGGLGWISGQEELTFNDRYSLL